METITKTVGTHKSAADLNVLTRMETILAEQKKAFLQDGSVSPDIRIDRINRVISLLLENEAALCQAMNADFGNRSLHQCRMADIVGTLETLKHSRKRLRRWMKPEKRQPMFPLGLLGARARVEYQPKGVVGNLATWNFPVHIPLGPLAGIFAAGNRAMIKLSEITPETSQLLEQLISQYFDQSELVGINGGPEVGAAFAALPFDHLIFTGATGIGRHILHAAADNLTPVTLELGGKSPVIIGRGADIKETALRIMGGKTLNSGQVCLSPDYVFVPRHECDALIDHLKNHLRDMFPVQANNPDCTSVVNSRHRQRLQAHLDDAASKGARLIDLEGTSADFASQEQANRLPLTVVMEPSDDMTVMQEEIFGPVLCIKTYQDIEECIRFVRSRPHPLALYYFGTDSQEERYVLDHTISGGVCVNDVMQHVSADDLPFGGIGASGMGNYHGRDGFKTFSHARSIYHQTRLNLLKLGGMLPPYGSRTEAQLKRLIKP
jgi:coniferyl-aldehyde dehydrogenase